MPVSIKMLFRTSDHTEVFSVLKCVFHSDCKDSEKVVYVLKFIFKGVFISHAMECPVARFPLYNCNEKKSFQHLLGRTQGQSSEMVLTLQ